MEDYVKTSELWGGSYWGNGYWGKIYGIRHGEIYRVISSIVNLIISIITFTFNIFISHSFPQIISSKSIINKEIISNSGVVICETNEYSELEDL